MVNLQKECQNNCSDTQAEANILIRLYVNTYDTILTWTTDESYSIDVTTKGKTISSNRINLNSLLILLLFFFKPESTVTVQITAQTVFGVRHGLETLSQLVAMSNGPKTLYRNALLMLTSAQIKDQPIFAHRGLSLDTARNFIPLKDITRTLDGMASCKLNIFHWHATDSQSFPLDMPRVPQLTR